MATTGMMDNPRDNFENYFSPKGPKLNESFDFIRKGLHDKISVMVVGKHRQGMDTGLAEDIADFAVEYGDGDVTIH